MTEEEAVRLNEQLIRAYKLAFGSPAGQAVLEDLSRFCRATATCAVPGNSDLTFVLLGRNEVWHRIQRAMNMTPDQLLTAKTEEDDDVG